MEKSYKVVDLKDLLAVFLDKWLVIVLVIVIGVVGGWGLCRARSGGNDGTTVVSADDVAAVRGSLNEADATQVDYLYARYRSYMDYRKLLQDYMASSLIANDDVEVLLNVLYCVDSSIQDVNSCFSTLALGKEETDEIVQILGMKDAGLQDVNRRISIGSTGIDIVRRAQQSVVVNTDVDLYPGQEILKVSIAADSEEQADEILAVVEKAFEKECDVLRDIDPLLELQKLGEQYSTDVFEYMISQQERVNDALDVVDESIKVVNEEIKNLDSGQEAYFDIKRDFDDEKTTGSGGPSLKKYMLAGGLAGLFFGFIIILLWYIFNGKMKTMVDVSMRTHATVPYVICKKKRGPYLFGPLSRRLKGANQADETVCREVVNSHLAIKVSREAYKDVYIACEGKNAWQCEVRDQLKQKLAESVTDLTIHSGTPLMDTEELKHFSEADAAILMIQLKDTRFYVADNWMELSRQYDRPVAGLVVTEEC